MDNNTVDMCISLNEDDTYHVEFNVTVNEVTLSPIFSIDVSSITSGDGIRFKVST